MSINGGGLSSSSLSSSTKTTHIQSPSKPTVCKTPLPFDLVEEIKPEVPREEQPRGRMKIEDKLIQGYKVTLRKIEEQKQRQEEALILSSPGKPKISLKTEDLAAKAEARFFTRHSPPRPDSKKLEKPASKTLLNPTPLSPGIPEKPIDRLVLESRASKPRQKPRSSSLRPTLVSSDTSFYTLSAVERGQLWQKRRDARLEKQRKDKSLKGLKECTFAPIIYSRIPHTMQQRNTHDLVSFAEWGPDKFDSELKSAEEASFFRGLKTAKRKETGFGAWADRRLEEGLYSFGGEEEIQPLQRDLSPYRISLQAFSPDRFLQRLSGTVGTGRKSRNGKMHL